MTEPVPSDGIVVRNARLAVKNELKKKRLLNQPIARFDPKSGKVYMQHAKQRGSWYGISPVTRTVPNGKAYDRNRVKREDRELAD